MSKHIFVDGSLVSQKVSQVIQAIKDYSPELDVKWCPPQARKPGDPAFKIIHTPPGKEPYTIFHVKTEEEFDSRILMRLIAGDQRNGEQHYSMLEAAEEAAKRVAHQKWLDQIEEANEIAASVLKSPKQRYKVSNDLVIDQNSPVNMAPKKRYL